MFRQDGYLCHIDKQPVMKLFRFLLPALLAVSSCGGGDKAAQEDGQRLFVGDDYAITQTQYGNM